MNRHDFLYRPFIELFCDSILFAYMANKTNSIHLENTFSRASIINSVFTLESVANSLLEKYDIKTNFSKEADKIEKYSTLDKYNFILNNYYNGDSLNRGDKKIQIIADLISIRNKFVHARSIKFKSNIFDYAFREEVHYEQSNISKSQFLKLPLSPRYWDKLYSKKVLENTIEFLNLFLIDKCKFSLKEIEQMLFSTFDNEIIYDYMHINFLKLAYKQFNIKIKFLNPEYV